MGTVKKKTKLLLVQETDSLAAPLPHSFFEQIF